MLNAQENLDSQQIDINFYKAGSVNKKQLIIVIFCLGIGFPMLLGSVFICLDWIANINSTLVTRQVSPIIESTRLTALDSERKQRVETLLVQIPWSLRGCYKKLERARAEQVAFNDF